MKQIAINDIGTAEDFLAAIDASIKIWKPKQPICGLVVQIDREGALLDIGDKLEAFIPKNEISNNKDAYIHDILQIGQVVEAIVLSKNEEGQYILSLKQNEVEAIWNDIQQSFELSLPIMGKVKKIIKGGLIVDIGVKAFLPGSQVETTKVDDFTGYIGQELELLIINFNREKQNVVVSRRSLLEQLIKEDKIIEFARMAVGQVHKGIVSGIEKYGAFIQIGSISGLVHVSKMNNQILEIGQEVEVEVIGIDLEKSRFSLALKG
jgi:small subunit ribosomal protein S1